MFFMVFIFLFPYSLSACQLNIDTYDNRNKLPIAVVIEYPKTQFKKRDTIGVECLLCSTQISRALKEPHMKQTSRVHILSVHASKKDLEAIRMHVSKNCNDCPKFESHGLDSTYYFNHLIYHCNFKGCLQPDVSIKLDKMRLDFILNK